MTAPLLMTVDDVFRLAAGTVVVPHLDAERLPRNSKLVIDVARPSDGSSRRIKGRFELWHLKGVDGTGGFEGVIVLDPEASDVVVAGDVLTIGVAEPNDL